MVMMPDLVARAARLRELHKAGDPLVLVNAWDVASAEHVVASGGRAIATSSAAIAASLGLPDTAGHVDAFLAVVPAIAAAVDVPVTADLFDGYGLEAGELVDRLLATGAVGCNLEDSDHAPPGRVLGPSVAANRLAGVRTAAERVGGDIVINAPIDSFLYSSDGPLSAVP